MHRNVSIDDVLTMLYSPLFPRIKLQVNPDLTKEPDGLMDGVKSAIGCLESDEHVQSRPVFEIDILKIATELESFVSAGLDGAMCAGFIKNGEFAQDWHRIFEEWGSDSILKYKESVS